MKLIDWSKLPKGTMTNFGEIICHYGDKVSVWDEKKYPFCVPQQTSDCRLALMTEWIYHDGGACPLPEGLVIQVKMYDFEGRKTAPISSDLWVGSIFPNAIGYRIIGVDRQGGYTDDPSEVTE
jgi:hypothetical protein